MNPTVTKTALMTCLSLLTVAACSSSQGPGGVTGTGGNSRGSGGSGATTGSGGGGGGPTGTGGTIGTEGDSGGTAAGTGGAANTGGSAGASSGVGGGPGNGGSAGAVATGGSAGTGQTTGTGGGAGTSACVIPPPAAAAGASDVVDGELIQFNDNGGWCWFQEERVVVDTVNGKLILGSDANRSGSGGTARDGQVEAVIYDLKTKTVEKPFQLKKLKPDDHNTPGFLIRPDGKYLTMYTGHNETCLSFYRTYDGMKWGPESSFDWGPHGCPTITTDTVRASYENLYYLSAEHKIYSFVRSVGASPNFLFSSDNGDTFAYGGRLTSTPVTGYVAGYYKYWGNGVDRIDFVATENHPRDVNTSLFHGYIKGGKSFDTSGKMVDGNISDATAPVVTEFTKLFAADTMVNGIKMTRAWMADFQTWPDGTMAVIFKARANNSETDHRFLYGRFDGSTWKTTYLSKAGTKLFGSEQDYTGLGALHPNDPHTIYISTTFDPRNDTTQFPKHEIFRGSTCDNGATWTWSPVTQKSTRDNLRPVVPAWDSKNTALLWVRGTYSTAQSYNETIVGIIKSTP